MATMRPSAPPAAAQAVVGSSPERVDARAKVTGRARYADDLSLPRMLFAGVAESPVARGRLLAVDRREALAVPGVVAVLTAADVPGRNLIPLMADDQPLLAERDVRYFGEALALVAAETPEAAWAGARAVRAEIVEAEGVFDGVAAMEPAAPRVHDSGNVMLHLKVRRGDPAAALSGADCVIEDRVRTGAQEHFYIETLGAVADPQDDGSMIVYGSLQCPYYVQRAVAAILGFPLGRVRIIQTATGGAFGGKEDVPNEVCACAALLAHRTARPVKLVYSREQDVRRSSKRHPMSMRYRLGASRSGKLAAVEAEIVGDVGAYATLSPAVLFRSNAHATGPYVLDHARVDTYGVYTDNPQSGAFRGFGQPQVCFGIETMMDRLAASLAMDPLDLRERNLLRVGTRTVSGQLLEESVGLERTLTLARRESAWDEKRRAWGPARREPDGRLRGIGAACCGYGVSLGAKGRHLDGSGAYVQLHQDGSATVAVGGTEIGQGAKTVLAQLAAETLGLGVDRIQIGDVDTARVPDSGPTVASRTTVMSGNAVLDAASQIAARLRPVAASLLGAPGAPVVLAGGRAFLEEDPARSLPLADLARECYLRKLNLAADGWFQAPPTSYDMETGQGDAYFVYSWATQVAEVAVSPLTGRVEVLSVTAAHDVGRALYPDGVLGQIEGGIVQGMGFALQEAFLLDRGRPLTDRFSNYIIPSCLDAPEIDIHLVEEPWSLGPFGAKGIGEPAIIPTAAAIANAVFHATGAPVSELPVSPEAVLRALAERPVRES
jgi:CO/xanthine dehydrogenase Mo-binding subunit